MAKSDLELFKQALNEGLSKRFDSLAEACTEEINFSDRHNLAMRAIVYGKTSNRRTLSPKMKRVIAILIAAALLLTSCAVIFRNELREVINEFFVAITFSDKVSGENFIEEVYELSYVPEGYVLDEKDISPLSAFYTYTNEDNQVILFQQRVLYGNIYIIDSEDGYSKIVEIPNYDVYFRDTTQYKNYIWTDGKYAFNIRSSTGLTNDELVAIINGITVK